MAKFIEVLENKKEISKIAERAQKFLDSENGIVITDPRVVATTTYVFLREAIKYLSEHKADADKTELNLLQLIDIGVSKRENDEAEKEGNYTPYANAGQEFKLLVKDDDDTEE